MVEIDVEDLLALIIERHNVAGRQRREPVRQGVNRAAETADTDQGTDIDRLEQVEIIDSVSASPCRRLVLRSVNDRVGAAVEQEVERIGA